MHVIKPKLLQIATVGVICKCTLSIYKGNHLHNEQKLYAFSNVYFWECTQHNQECISNLGLLSSATCIF